MFKPSPPEKVQAWQDRILQQQNSDLSIERWCRENQVATCQFHYWKSKIYPKQIDASSFTELVDQKHVGVTIKCSGMSIQLDLNFDAVTLKRCLSVIRELTC